VDVVISRLSGLESFQGFMQEDPFMRSGQVLAPWRVIAAAALLCAPPAMGGTQHAVAELFTSLGCSSCPPADALAGRLSADPAVLVLSFHVNYWDSPAFRDPFASQASTDRQNAYARHLHERSVFTPQLIVNGTLSLIGSREAEIQKAVGEANRVELPVMVNLSRQPDASFALTLEGTAAGAEVWEVRYVRQAVTEVRGGENGGHALTTYNNVTHFLPLGKFAPGTRRLLPLKAPEDGLAVVVQAAGMGRVLGASTYQ
jgi:hypothetical protein